MPKNKRIFEYLAVFALVVGIVVTLACTGDDDNNTPDFTGMAGRWDFSAAMLQSGTATAAIGEAPAEVTSAVSINYYTGYFYFDANGAITGGYAYLNGSTTALTISAGQTYVNKDSLTYTLQFTLSNGDVLTIERWAPNAVKRYINGRISSSLYGYGMWDGFRYDSSITFGSATDFSGTWNFALTNSAGYVAGSFSVGNDGTIYDGEADPSVGVGTTLTGSLSDDTGANVTSTLTYGTSTLVFRSVKMNGSKNAMGGIAQDSNIGTGRLIAYRKRLTSFSYANLSGEWLMTILDLNSSLWYVGVVSMSGTSSTTISGTIWKSTTASEYGYSGTISVSTAGEISATMAHGTTESFSIDGMMNSTADAIQGIGTSSVEGTFMCALVKLPTSTATAITTDTTGSSSNFYTYTTYSGYSYSYSWNASPMNLWRNEVKARELVRRMLAEGSVKVSRNI